MHRTLTRHREHRLKTVQRPCSMLSTGAGGQGCLVLLEFIILISDVQFHMAIEGSVYVI